MRYSEMTKNLLAARFEFANRQDVFGRDFANVERINGLQSQANAHCRSYIKKLENVSGESIIEIMDELKLINNHFDGCADGTAKDIICEKIDSGEWDTQRAIEFILNV